MKQRYFFEFFLLLCLVIVTEASEIHFSSSGSIMPLLTDNLTMTCTINKTTAPTSSGAVVGRRDVSLTSENIHPLAMLIVRGNGEKVASLTQFSPAKSLINGNNIYVSGRLDGNPVSQGYLEVRWEYPTMSEVNDYKCEVSTVTDEGHGITFSKNVSIDVSTPTMDDLIHHIHANKEESRQQRAEYQAQLSSLKAENQALLTSLNTKLLKSQTEIEHLKHIEIGHITCASSRNSDWSDGLSGNTGEGGRVIEKTDTFKKTYDKPPIVFLSILEPDYMSYEHSDKLNNVNFGISLKSVNINGIVVQCYAENMDGSKSYLYRLKAAWISFSS